MTGTVPFAPTLPTVTRSVNTGSQSVALGTVGQTSESTPTPQGYPTFPGGFSVRVANDSTVTVFIQFGVGAATAAVATSVPLLPGTSEIFTVNPNTTHIAAIAASGSGTIYATCGQGI